MPKQDSRVQAEQEDIEDFHILVTGNHHSQIIDILEENPTLIYSIDEHCHTALYYAAATGGPANIETARILMAHGAEPQNSNVGEALQLIDDPFMMQDMARIVVPGIQFNDYSQSNGAVERAEAYLNREETKQVDYTLKAIASGGGKKGYDKKGGDKCTIMSVHDITYGQELSNIFKNMNPLNMDEQKKFDQQAFEISHPLLQGISFAPMMFETASSNDLSIIVIPKEIVDFGYEQFTYVIGKLHELYDQYFGHSND